MYLSGVQTDHALHNLFPYVHRTLATNMAHNCQILLPFVPESVYVHCLCGWQLLVQVELVVSHVVDCRLYVKLSTTVCLGISHDKEDFTIGSHEGITVQGTMSRDRLVEDKYVCRSSDKCTSQYQKQSYFFLPYNNSQ